MNEEMDVKSSIDTLTNAMEAGFAGLRAELEKVRLEFKHKIERMKGKLKSLKESTSFTQGEVNTLKEKSKENVKEMKDLGFRQSQFLKKNWKLQLRTT